MTVVSRFLVALLFLAFVIEQAPHIVHHFFDLEHAGAECPFATAGERLPGLGAEAIDVDHDPAPELRTPLPGAPALPDTLVRGPFARAPPASPPR
jgi:hypothetical protein